MREWKCTYSGTPHPYCQRLATATVDQAAWQRAVEDVHAAYRPRLPPTGPASRLPAPPPASRRPTGRQRKVTGDEARNVTVDGIWSRRGDSLVHACATSSADGAPEFGLTLGYVPTGAHAAGLWLFV